MQLVQRVVAGEPDADAQVAVYPVQPDPVYILPDVLGLDGRGLVGVPGIDQGQRFMDILQAVGLVPDVRGQGIQPVEHVRAFINGPLIGEAHPALSVDREPGMRVEVPVHIFEIKVEPAAVGRGQALQQRVADVIGLVPYRPSFHLVQFLDHAGAPALVGRPVLRIPLDGTVVLAVDVVEYPPPPPAGFQRLFQAEPRHAGRLLDMFAQLVPGMQDHRAFLTAGRGRDDAVDPVQPLLPPFRRHLPHGGKTGGHIHPEVRTDQVLPQLPLLFVKLVPDLLIKLLVLPADIIDRLGEDVVLQAGLRFVIFAQALRPPAEPVGGDLRVVPVCGHQPFGRGVAVEIVAFVYRQMIADEVEETDLVMVTGDAAGHAQVHQFFRGQQAFDPPRAAVGGVAQEIEQELQLLYLDPLFRQLIADGPARERLMIKDNGPAGLVGNGVGDITQEQLDLAVIIGHDNDLGQPAGRAVLQIGRDPGQQEVDLA